MAEVRPAVDRGRHGGTFAGARGLRFETLESRRMMTIVHSGAENDTAASLYAYEGANSPGDPNVPGFDNVGRGSTGNSTVFYLGGGWIITANHVTIDNPENLAPGGVFFGGQQYRVDLSSKHQLYDPVNVNEKADLALYKIYDYPDLPVVLPGYLATTIPSGDVYMIGNGQTRGAAHSWHVNTAVNPWVWTETMPYNASGYDTVSPRKIRWGENQVMDTNQYFNFGSNSIRYFTTQFGGATTLTHEGQASTGDSGGPVFYKSGDTWLLSGLMNTITQYSGQPSNTAVFGNTTLAADLSKYRAEILRYAGVVNRHVFYNNSGFDGDTPGIDDADDSAIATDKVAYMAGGGTAIQKNVTSSEKGINGIMVDLATTHGALSLADFTFKVSDQGLDANNAPSTWSAAPTPSGFLVRPGEGEGGSDRVEFVWADGAIKDRWLQVTVEGNDATGGFNANTGLAVSDIFFFGNKVGATFLNDDPGAFQSDQFDQIAVRYNQGITLSPTNVFDFNRDFNVDPIDEIIARFNQGYLIAIDIANPPAGPLPEGGDEDGGAAVASALASTSLAIAPLDVPVSESLNVVPSTAHLLDAERVARERAYELMAGDSDDPWPSLADDSPSEDDAAGVIDFGLNLNPLL